VLSCCSPITPLYFSPIWSGIPGRLETAIHVTCHYITQHVSDSSLGLLKIDMKNAFNECSCSAFFNHIVDDFPEISAWIKWCATLSQLSFVLALDVYWPLLGCNKVIHWDLCFPPWFYCSLSIL